MWATWSLIIIIRIIIMTCSFLLPAWRQLFRLFLIFLPNQNSYLGWWNWLKVHYMDQINKSLSKSRVQEIIIATTTSDRSSAHWYLQSMPRDSQNSLLVNILIPTSTMIDSFVSHYIYCYHRRAGRNIIPLHLIDRIELCKKESCR